VAQFVTLPHKEITGGPINFTLFILLSQPRHATIQKGTHVSNIKGDPETGPGNTSIPAPRKCPPRTPQVGLPPLVIGREAGVSHTITPTKPVFRLFWTVLTPQTLKGTYTCLTVSRLLTLPKLTTLQLRFPRRNRGTRNATPPGVSLLPQPSFLHITKTMEPPNPLGKNTRHKSLNLLLLRRLKTHRTNLGAQLQRNRRQLGHHQRRSALRLAKRTPRRIHRSRRQTQDNMVRRRRGRIWQDRIPTLGRHKILRCNIHTIRDRTRHSTPALQAQTHTEGGLRRPNKKQRISTKLPSLGNNQGRHYLLHQVRRRSSSYPQTASSCFCKLFTRQKQTLTR